MGRFDGVLFCTDLDGTVLTSEKTVSKENHDAIEYFKSEGGYFTFITGRMPCTSAKICEMLNPNVPYGCINGGGLFDNQKNEFIWLTSLDEGYIDLIECVDKNVPSVGIQVNTADVIYFSKDSSSNQRFRRATNSPFIEKNYHDIDEPVGKILFADSNEENLLKAIELLNNHPMAEKFDFIRSQKDFYEILPKGISKGFALKKLAKYLDADKTIAIGDYNNDISMIKEADIGCAVANACDDLKKIADFISVSNNESAIAYVINKLDEGALTF